MKETKTKLSHEKYLGEFVFEVLVYKVLVFDLLKSDIFLSLMVSRHSVLTNHVEHIRKVPILVKMVDILHPTRRK